MKLSTTILIIMLAFVFTSLFATSLIFKQTYNRIDQSDLYWNYIKILNQPFKHLKIEGGNVTNIIFEPNVNCSVRVLDYWEGYVKDSTVKVSVKNDTLYLRFLYKPTNPGDKSWLQSRAVLRIAAPQLLSVDGYNTNFEMDKMRQKSIKINLSGRSMLEVESNIAQFDSLAISQADSAKVMFEMNPALKGPPVMKVRCLTASIKGESILDIGRMQVEKSVINIADTSAVILSGKTYRHQQINSSVPNYHDLI